MRSRTQHSLQYLPHNMLSKHASKAESHSCAAHRPAARHSSSFNGSSAGCEDEYGSVMPSASAAHAMVLAVYMPPHAPAPGHALRTMSARWRSSIKFAAQAPGGRKNDQSDDSEAVKSSMLVNAKMLRQLDATLQEHSKYSMLC